MMETVTCLAIAVRRVIDPPGATNVALAAWARAKPVEHLVPTGTGGGASAQARHIQGGAFGGKP